MRHKDLAHVNPVTTWNMLGPDDGVGFHGRWFISSRGLVIDMERLHRECSTFPRPRRVSQDAPTQSPESRAPERPSAPANGLEFEIINGHREWTDDDMARAERLDGAMEILNIVGSGSGSGSGSSGPSPDEAAAHPAATPSDVAAPHPAATPSECLPKLS